MGGEQRVDLQAGGGRARTGLEVVEHVGDGGGPVTTTSLTVEMDPKAASELYRHLVTGRA